jgi:8-oxo-dGTP diphosphatase
MILVAAAVIEREGCLLICQRKKEDTLPLKWEFPGGKLEPGESPEEALKRELQEELSVLLRRSCEIARVQHTYPDQREAHEIRFFAVEIGADEIRPTIYEQVAWVLPKQLADYDFLAANAELVAHLATGKIKPAEMLEALGPDS